MNTTLETETEVVTEPTNTIELTTKKKKSKNKMTSEIKRSKGRPNIHPLAGRTYLLKNEIDGALEDPQLFANTLADMHELSEERRNTLLAADYLQHDNNVELTINGPVLETINRAKTIGETLTLEGYNVSFRMSKERLVPAGKPLALPRETQLIEINGKQVTQVVKDEFSPTRIYVYITAAK